MFDIQGEIVSRSAASLFNMLLSCTKTPVVEKNASYHPSNPRQTVILTVQLCCVLNHADKSKPVELINL